MTLGALLNTAQSLLDQSGTESGNRIHVNKAVISPPNDAGNKIIERLPELQRRLGYRCPTMALPDRNKRSDSFLALEFAREARDTWADHIRSEVGSDVNRTDIIGSLGGTGVTSLMWTDLPERITGRPVVLTTVASHRMRGTPTPAESRNTVVAYEQMQHKVGQSGYARVLLSNMTDRYGYEGFLDEVALFQALLPLFDLSDIEGEVFTGACKEIEAGRTVDNLREPLKDECFHLFRNPWFRAADWDWVDPPDEPPLRGAEFSKAFCLLPERFEDEFTDVNPPGAPELEPVTAAADNAYLMVIRPVTEGFVRDMHANTREWFLEEVSDPESPIGAEARRRVGLRRRKLEVAPDEARRAYDDLLEDSKPIE